MHAVHSAKSFVRHSRVVVDAPPRAPCVSLLLSPAAAAAAADSDSAAAAASSDYDAGADAVNDRIRFRVRQVLVFINTKKNADMLGRQLEQAGFPAGVLHGGKTQASFFFFGVHDNLLLYCYVVSSCTLYTG